MKPVVIVIGGTDSSGGAGLSRDIATLTQLGCEARPVVTAVTAQTDSEVNAVVPISSEVVAQQLSAALSLGDVAAIKTGMLHSAETVVAIATRLGNFPAVPLVIDPVLASSSGTALLDQQGIDALKQTLLPLCTLVTPNLPEAGLLTGQTLIEEQAASLLALGATAVLIKGGHGTSDRSVDRLFRPNQSAREFTSPRLEATLRGTGCMLASAIAAGLAAGSEIAAACEISKHFVGRMLRHAQLQSSANQT